VLALADRQGMTDCYGMHVDGPRLQAFAMGVGMGQEYLNANMKRYIPWFTSAWHSLKYYFAVNHHYVQRKLLVLLFPFTKKQWTRYCCLMIPSAWEL
jgi:hypothetical protein